MFLCVCLTVHSSQCELVELNMYVVFRNNLNIIRYLCQQCVQYNDFWKVVVKINA